MRHDWPLPCAKQTIIHLVHVILLPHARGGQEIIEGDVRATKFELLATAPNDKECVAPERHVHGTEEYCCKPHRATGEGASMQDEKLRQLVTYAPGKHNDEAGRIKQKAQEQPIEVQS